MHEKNTLRQQMIARRHAFPFAEKRQANRTIHRALIDQPEWQKASTVCLYISLPEEADTRALLPILFGHKTVVAVPRVTRLGLTLHRIRSISELTESSFHILEPKDSCPIVATSSIDLFIVPGIAFDRKGYRLGWGKGYYDRLLCDVSVPKIGLAYSCQLIPRLPHSSYDIPMTHLITEKEVIEV